MLNALSEELNWTNTENGALAYHDTGDACLNLFAGSLCKTPERHVLGGICRESGICDADPVLPAGYPRRIG